MLGLVEASSLGLDFCEGGRSGCQSRARSGVSGCVVRGPGPALREHCPCVLMAVSRYLLLQPDDTGPLLLQNALVLFLGRIVEGGGDVGLFAQCRRRFGRVDDTQIC